ncbi:putative capsid protein [Erysiphe necator]|uniref:Putative capsid protein n=1 Tax=Uncinula necator TaxID=52586 RepID=A0A0B1NYZ1_UNCNE|nr:putative capsid protein [Erysiphe necator]
MWRIESTFKVGPPPAGNTGYGAQTVQSHETNLARWQFPSSDADVSIGFLFSPAKSFTLHPRLVEYSKKKKGSNNRNKIYAVEESSDELLNIVRHVNISDKYESDDSLCLNVPCDAAYAVPQVIKNPDWYLDTCVSKHNTPNLDVFIAGSLKLHKVSIKCADNNVLLLEGIGDV